MSFVAVVVSSDNSREWCCSFNGEERIERGEKRKEKRDRKEVVTAVTKISCWLAVISERVAG